MMARVYFDFTDSSDFTLLADPFGYNAIRLNTMFYTPLEINTKSFPVSGFFLLNRIAWFAVALGLLGVTYRKFNFRNYFDQHRKGNGVEDPAAIEVTGGVVSRKIKPDFSGAYFLSTVRTLVKVELRSIFRDNFFMVIVAVSCFFIGFSFWLGTQNYQVRDLPRTAA